MGSFQGTAQAFQSSTQGLGLILLMAIFVIYVVLGILYESFIHPLTILSGLPAAGFGALLTLMIFKSDLNLYAFVGVIMLVGLVKKNGIMMIDFAIEARRNEGKSAVEAIYEACLVRFRPIMMTTMAALAGTLPIALGLGAGAEARRPLGLAVVGGLRGVTDPDALSDPRLLHLHGRPEQLARARAAEGSEVRAPAAGSRRCHVIAAPLAHTAPMPVPAFAWEQWYAAVGGAPSASTPSTSTCG